MHGVCFTYLCSSLQGVCGIVVSRFIQVCKWYDSRVILAVDFDRTDYDPTVYIRVDGNI